MFQAPLWTNWMFGRNVHLFCPHEDACRLMDGGRRSQATTAPRLRVEFVGCVGSVANPQ